MKLVSMAMAAAVLGGAVHAEEVFDGAAIGTGQAQNEIIALGENHLVMHAVGIYGPVATADVRNPMTGLPGKCFGSIEILGASASGSGHCVFAEGSSRAVVTGWEVTGVGADGSITGEWTVIGAGGSATGLTGGGSFSNLTDRATGMFTNNITGELTLP